MKLLRWDHALVPPVFLAFTLQKYTVPGTVQQTQPVSGDTVRTDSVQLTWNVGTPSVTRYQVQWSTDSAFATSTLDSSVTIQSKVAKPLLDNTTYYWRVRAFNSSGWGAYSNTGMFMVVFPPVGILPREFSLQNLNSGLNFTLPYRTRVQARLLDSRGRTAMVMLDEVKDAGVYNMKMPQFPTGNYLLDFKAGEFRKTVKMGR